MEPRPTPIAAQPVGQRAQRGFGDSRGWQPFGLALRAREALRQMRSQNIPGTGSVREREAIQYQYQLQSNTRLQAGASR